METIKTLSRVEGVLAADLAGYGGAHSYTHPDREEQKTHLELKKIVKHFQIVKASSEDSEYFFGGKEDKEKIATSSAK